MERKIKQALESQETKHLKKGCEIKSIDSQGRFSGYASVFNIEDSYKDIILPKSFNNTLKNRNIQKEVKLLWQHSPEEPIGYFETIKEDSVGLYVEGQLMLDVERGREAYSLIKSGAVSGLSIGYNVKQAYKNEKSGVRVIGEVDLWEISVVTFPANKLSNITFIKNSKPFKETKEMKISQSEEFKKLNIALDKALNVLEK